jgi:hypothetical protein
MVSRLWKANSEEVGDRIKIVGADLPAADLGGAISRSARQRTSSNNFLVTINPLKRQLKEP